ncbi:hypothetical protein X767_12045 [Mesorhizobium sp. LSJC264A00]|nr:hypothetical protein X767_12045 [Mesorhizobium sp. LSJC264A00]
MRERLTGLVTTQFAARLAMAETPVEGHLFPVDRSRHSPYVPRNFEGGL